MRLLHEHWLYLRRMRRLCRRILLRIWLQERAERTPDPLKPGKTAPEIALTPGEVSRILRTAATQVGEERAREVLWRDGNNELLVRLSAVSATIDHGIVRVSVPVACDEVEQAAIEMFFAVGDAQRPAGMIASTESRPRGPAAIVDLWQDQLLAFGWQLLLKVATGVAAESGRDEAGDPLVPVSLKASPDRLSILPMARHAFTRKLDGRPFRTPG